MPEIDPWGDVEIGNYKQKMENFGINPIEEVAEQLPDHRFVRRKIIFGHRGMEEYLEALHDGQNVAMMTGLMPSGNFHFGHKTVLDQVKMYKEMGAEINLCAADIEAHNMRDMSLEEARKTVIEQYLINYVALGIDLEDVNFWFQSGGSIDYHVQSKLFSKHLTQNEIESTYGNASPGKISSALTQYADILKPQIEGDAPVPTVVPVGVDQDPHIRLTRDVASRFSKNYAKPASTYNKFMRGLQGGKMSSSDPKSHISLSDSVEEAKNKIDDAKTGGRDTLEEHRAKGAKVQEDMIYEMLTFHLEEDDSELERIREEYSSGEMLSGEIKQIAKQKIEEFLREHHERRADARDKVYQYVEENTNVKVPRNL